MRRRGVDWADRSGVEREEWRGEIIADQSDKSRSSWSNKSRFEQEEWSEDSRVEHRTIGEKCRGRERRWWKMVWWGWSTFITLICYSLSTPLFSLHSAPICSIYSSPPHFHHFPSFRFNCLRLLPSALSDPLCPLCLFSAHLISPLILLYFCSSLYCLLRPDRLNLSQLAHFCSAFCSSGHSNFY